MARIPLTGQSFEGVSIDVDFQRTVNWYPESAPTGKDRLPLLPMPGLVEFTSAGSGPVRAMIVLNNVMYVVSSDTLYSVTTVGTVSLIGTITTTSGRCELSHNGNDILIVDGLQGYLYDLSEDVMYPLKVISGGTADGTTSSKLINSGATFVTDGVKVGVPVYNTTDGTSTFVSAVDSDTQLSLDSDIFVSGEDYEVGDGDFPAGATSCTFLDTYFIVNDPDNTNAAGVPGAFFISDSYNGSTWASLDYEVAERSWDQLEAVRVANGQLWLVGENSTEVWWHNGNADFPFERISSAVIEFGTPAGASVAEADNTLILLAGTDHGQGQIMQNQGYDLVKKSHAALDDKIHSYLKTDSFSFVFQWKGHTFCVFTFPNADKTWVYDLSTGLWFQWSTNGHDNRHIGSSYTYFNNKHYVGSRLTGKIYELSDTAYDDDGTAITRLRQTPHIHFEGKTGFIRAVELILEQGVATGAVPDPQVMLQWSKDRGHTWQTEQWRDVLGSTGEYSKASTWRRIGKCQDIMFRIKITDAVKAVLIGAYMDAKTGQLEVT